MRVFSGPVVGLSRWRTTTPSSARSITRSRPLKRRRRAAAECSASRTVIIGRLFGSRWVTSSPVVKIILMSPSSRNLIISSQFVASSGEVLSATSTPAFFAAFATSRIAHVGTSRESSSMPTRRGPRRSANAAATSRSPTSEFAPMHETVIFVASTPAISCTETPVRSSSPISVRLTLLGVLSRRILESLGDPTGGPSCISCIPLFASLYVRLTTGGLPPAGSSSAPT